MGGRGADTYHVGYGSNTAVFRGTRINRKLWSVEVKREREALRKLKAHPDYFSARKSIAIHNKRLSDLMAIGKKMKWKK